MVPDWLCFDQIAQCTFCYSAFVPQGGSKVLQSCAAPQIRVGHRAVYS